MHKNYKKDSVEIQFEDMQKLMNRIYDHYRRSQRNSRR